jgi:hypothetical protein
VRWWEGAEGRLPRLAQHWLLEISRIERTPANVPVPVDWRNDGVTALQRRFIRTHRLNSGKASCGVATHALTCLPPPTGMQAPLKSGTHKLGDLKVLDPGFHHGLFLGSCVPRVRILGDVGHLVSLAPVERRLTR